MNVAEYIVKYLEEYGVEYCFSVVGGGAMYLNHAFAQSEKIKTVYMQTEQACAIAAEGYYRTSGKLPVVNVTTGPGGLNTLTGVMGQWTDSIPCLYISGQVNTDTLLDGKLRQLGDQEVDIVSVVKPITKYVKMITDGYNIDQYLSLCINIATSNRMGPVWLDVPLNVQNSKCEIEEIQIRCEWNDHQVLSIEEKDQFYKMLDRSERPLFVVGHGIRLSNCQRMFKELNSKLKIPCVTTFNGFDLLENDYPYFIGRIGTLGTRAGNIALQNSDLVIFLGTRNNIRQVSYQSHNFAKNAKKIVIDIDDQEMNKSTLTYSKNDLKIHNDLYTVIFSLLETIDKEILIDYSEWNNWCITKKNKYPLVERIHKNPGIGINPYIFMDEFTKNLKKDSVVVCANGTACVSMFQAGTVNHSDQRFFWNSGCASMGYALPASIGACLANDKKEVICIEGDGSIMMNLESLQTIIDQNLPIKIFLLDNGGYHSITQTQNRFFNRNIHGCTKETGIGFPYFEKISRAFGLRYHYLHINTTNLSSQLDYILKMDGPYLCHISLNKNYEFAPRVSTKKLQDGTLTQSSFEDMYPFLSHDEIKENWYE